jgi:hypothetical protein
MGSSLLLSIRAAFPFSKLLGNNLASPNINDAAFSITESVWIEEVSSSVATVAVMKVFPVTLAAVGMAGR